MSRRGRDKVVYIAGDDGRRYKLTIDGDGEPTVGELPEDDENRRLIEYLTDLGVKSASNYEPNKLRQDDRFAAFGVWVCFDISSIHYLNLGVAGNPKGNGGGVPRKEDGHDNDDYGNDDPGNDD